MEPLIPDRFNWRGCKAVRFDPEKLSGAATVGDYRLSADAVYEKYLHGMSAEEISQEYETDVRPIRAILEYAVAHDLQPRRFDVLVLGFIWVGQEQLLFKITDVPGVVRMDMRRRDSTESMSTGAGLWPDVKKARAVAQEITDRLFGPDHELAWTDHSDQHD